VRREARFVERRPADLGDVGYMREGVTGWHFVVLTYAARLVAAHRSVGSGASYLIVARLGGVARDMLRWGLRDVSKPLLG
jgi:hypothetical protein